MWVQRLRLYYHTYFSKIPISKKGVFLSDYMFYRGVRAVSKTPVDPPNVRSTIHFINCQSITYVLSTKYNVLQYHLIQLNDPYSYGAR